MNQQPRLPWRYGTSTPASMGFVSVGLVSMAAAGSAVAHVVAAVSGPVGVMAWWMLAMGAACLSCVAPMAGFPARRLRPCARQAAPRAAGHLLAMSAAMILIHLGLFLGPPANGHHGLVHSSTTPDHQWAMLAIIGIELLCLMAASAALRMARAQTPPRN
ncbi:hypothetical protein [Arthrobacter sp. ISL-95]|uniref:hypothetical protein n=1 Tax=Arthrobacter sp. ISL-95 TaxID=2819116 RepID=UPI001BE999EE|nr:hypothetical protein [Arthrobacter sp. ISL-95]MBT2584935.1 hypothetical protein [Arthrobacter sp. ISL-95]